MTIEVKVPDLGGATSVDVIEVLVKVGDKIEKEDSIVTLEGDKASMEVPAPVSGTVKEIKVKVGDQVSEESLLLLVDSAEAPKSESESKPETTPTKEEPKPAAAATSSVQDIAIPDLGGASDVDVIEILVKPGDSVEKDDSLIVLEGDKASMEVPAIMAGTIKDLKIKLGDKVNQGDLMLTMEVAGVEAPAAVTKTEVAKPATQTQAAPAKMEEAKVTTSAEDIHAGPAVRRIAYEFGVDLTKVTGTGEKGRIIKEDVQKYVKSALSGQGASVGGGLAVAPAPVIDFSKFGETETKALSKIKRLTGVNTHRSWVTVPHVTQFDEADITEMEAFRKAKKAEAEKQGYKLTPLVFMMKAVVKCLQAFPNFNASLDASGENLILKKYFNIGVAADTPNGLVVPVIRDCDKKGLFELSKELVDISKKAREKGLTVNEMSGSCFTISSLGGIGGTAFTPIVNTPDVAILGVSKSQMKPVWNGKEFVPRLMLPLSLSYDHRVIDGAEAARFTSHLAKLLTDIRELLL